MASATLIFATLLLITVASAADPTCSSGIEALGACCPAVCKSCGGPSCGSRSRANGVKCCIGAIIKTEPSCLISDPPCKMPEMPMETEKPMETEPPMEMEKPMETEMPAETEKPEKPKKKRICTSNRKKFMAGCFCYLIFSGKLKVKRSKFFRVYCKKALGSRKKILSLVFTCRKFQNGSKASEKVLKLIKRLNEIIPLCGIDLPKIMKKM